LMPDVPWACTATRRPSIWASSTSARISVRSYCCPRQCRFSRARRRAAKFDDLRAVLAQFAHRGSDLLRAIRHRGVQGRDRGRKRGAVAMAAGRADRVGGGYDTRSDYHPLFDALLDRDVVVIRRTDVPDRGEASLERLLSIRNPDHGPKIIVNSR